MCAEHFHPPRLPRRRAFRLVEPERTLFLQRIHRLEGQMRGIEAMLDDEQECEDILIQMAAIIAGTRSAAVTLLKVHVRDCVLCEESTNRSDVSEELIRVVERFSKSLM